MTGYTLNRADLVPALVGDQKDFLFISGLAGATRDVTRLTNDGGNSYALGGVMGSTLAVGLGLALAQPSRHVMVVTGDGDLLMGMGTLATIGVLNPPNLSILCIDNGLYQETGGQASHTSRGVDLELVARGCGIQSTARVATHADIAGAAALLRKRGQANFVLAFVSPELSPRFKRVMDAAQARVRFRANLDLPVT